jgi:Mrp family chromosome partitioning ATPase
VHGIFSREEVSYASVAFADSDLRRVGHFDSTASGSRLLPEELRTIKRRLSANIRAGANATNRDPRILLVTSSVPGEGKSFVAHNLALSFAIEKTLDVTLVDGSITTPDMSKRMRLSNAAGLLDVLDDTSLALADVLHQTNVPNLSVIPTGNARVNGPELLSSFRMAETMAQLANRSNNHIVVIDSDAVLSGSHASAIAEHSGQILYVLASNVSRREDVDQGLSLMDGAIGPLDQARLGLVLNRINPAQSTARYTVGRRK